MTTSVLDWLQNEDCIVKKRISEISSSPVTFRLTKDPRSRDRRIVAKFGNDS